MELAAEKPVVTLFVTHSNLTSMSAETRFNRSHTVAKIKDKLYMTTGTAPGFQELVLRDSAGTDMALLSDESQLLGFYSPADGMTLHVRPQRGDTSAYLTVVFWQVIDRDPASISKDGALEDTSAVEKFKLSEDKYASAGGSDFRKFRAARAKRAAKVDDTYQAEEAKELSAGSRCELPSSGRRGTIRYVGLIPEIKPGFWVGIELDEPTGKNNGSVKGKSYFEAEAKFGTFVRPKAVRQGDYPPVDLMDEDDDEI